MMVIQVVRVSCVVVRGVYWQKTTVCVCLCLIVDVFGDCWMFYCVWCFRCVVLMTVVFVVVVLWSVLPCDCICGVYLVLLSGGWWWVIIVDVCASLIFSCGCLSGVVYPCYCLWLVTVWMVTVGWLINLVFLVYFRWLSIWCIYVCGDCGWLFIVGGLLSSTVLCTVYCCLLYFIFCLLFYLLSLIFYLLFFTPQSPGGLLVSGFSCPTRVAFHPLKKGDKFYLLSWSHFRWSGVGGGV